MADGGPGFVDVLHAALGGELLAVTVAGPFGEPTPATVLLAGATAYVESAQACGLHLTGGSAPRRPRPTASASWSWRRSTPGPGRSSSGSVAAAPTTAAPGCWRPSAPRPTVRSTRGRPASRASPPSTSRPSRARLDGVALVAASDVDNPLTGLFGATKTFGPQKGLAEDRLPVVDGWLEAYAAALDRRTVPLPGAGAAGGLGYALLALGASRRPGIDVVDAATRLAERARAADLVVTGEGAFDFSSRAGKVPYGVARSRPTRSGRAWRWPARCWSAPARCARSASRRRTRSSTWWGRSAPSPSPPPRWRTSPSGSPGPGRAERSGSPIGMPRNNPRVRRIETGSTPVTRRSPPR